MTRRAVGACRDYTVRRAIFHHVHASSVEPDENWRTAMDAMIVTVILLGITLTGLLLSMVASPPPRINS
jgi:hypothetical protein